MRRTTVILFFAFLLVGAPAFAASLRVPHSSDTLNIPAASMLRFRAFDQDGTAKFDGPIKLSGAWYYGGNPIDDGTANDSSLYFVPDRESAARLPSFKERGQPSAVYITNASAFLKGIVPESARAALARTPGKYLSGKIDIWVDEFEAGIECDAPFFNARFLRVAEPPLRVALADLPDVGC